MPCGTQLPVCIIYKKLQNLFAPYFTTNQIFRCDLPYIQGKMNSKEKDKKQKKNPEYLWVKGRETFHLGQQTNKWFLYWDVCEEYIMYFRGNDFPLLSV